MTVPDRSSRGDAATHPSGGGERVLVALGSNLGDREAMLRFARTRIVAHPACRIVAATEPEETAPLGPQDQPPYLNQMLSITTTLSPIALLDVLQDVEREAGRVRDVRWGPRTLDCDVVRFGDRELRHPRLVVPHPELPNRDFWRREIALLDDHAGAATARASVGRAGPARRTEVEP